MQVTQRVRGDRDRLAQMIKTERDARRRDRLRAVLMALDGDEARHIADKLGRSRRAVQDWVYRYRDGGLDHIHPPPRPGRPPKLPRQREDELRARLDAGPRPGDGVCTLRGVDVVRILEAEFGVRYSLDGTYDLLGRLGYSCLSPRPRHERHDAAAQQAFRRSAPLLSSVCGDARRARAARGGGCASSSWTRPASASRAR